MDLGNLEDKLNRRLYETKQEFFDDLSLIVDNCVLYNGEFSGKPQC